ncbi:MAG: hypothetical protein ABWX68_10940 [Arthrobacter sp.]|uniref:hypothetical protein n=1 Tax=Arthrobacter sp. TaxID=1667 RepID=UPI0034915B43
MPADFFATLSPGERIVVRYRLGPDGEAPGGVRPGGRGPAAGGERFTDALGDFVGLAPSATGDGVLVVVRTRAGEARIPRAAVARAKRVPPAPARRRPRAGGGTAPGTGIDPGAETAPGD